MSRDFMENLRITGLFYSIFSSRRQILDGLGTGRPQHKIALMELIGDDCVLDQKLEGNDLEGVFVGGFEDDRAGGSGTLDIEPAGGANTPPVAGFEAGETVLRHGGTEVVAKSLGRFKEWSVDDAADGVDAMVFGARLATACAVETRHGLAAADFERLAQDVFAAVFDGFDSGHRFYCRSRRTTADFAD
jgi:hypothetical protein